MAKKSKKPKCKDDEKAQWFDFGGGKGEWRCVKKTGSSDKE